MRARAQSLSYVNILFLAVLSVFLATLSIIGAYASTSVHVFTDPEEFEVATAEMGTSIVIDFEDAVACPGDTIKDCEPFNGDFYADKGIIFSNPNEYPLFIALGGLFWNEDNSLSVGRFPNDPLLPLLYNEDDDLIVTFTIPIWAVGFTFVESSCGTDEYVEFIDSTGSVIARTGFSTEDFEPNRAFLGIVFEDTPITIIHVVEAPNDMDDVNYDDFIFFTRAPDFVIPELSLGTLMALISMIAASILFVRARA